MRVVEEPLRRHVIVLINDVCLQFAHLVPEKIELLTLWPRSRAGDQCDIGMFRLEDFGELFVAFDILRPPLFVADADHLQVEWSGMAQFGAFAAPDSGDRAVGEFDQIERILKVWVEPVERRQLLGIELASHPAVDNRQWLSAGVLTKLEIFEKPQTKRLEVILSGAVGIAAFELHIPAIHDETPLLYVPDRRLPLIAIVQIAAFDNAPSGKAHESRFQITEQLRQVGA